MPRHRSYMADCCMRSLGKERSRGISGLRCPSPFAINHPRIGTTERQLRQKEDRHIHEYWIRVIWSSMGRPRKPNTHKSRHTADTDEAEYTSSGSISSNTLQMEGGRKGVTTPGPWGTRALAALALSSFSDDSSLYTSAAAAEGSSQVTARFAHRKGAQVAGNLDDITPRMQSQLDGPGILQGQRIPLGQRAGAHVASSGRANSRDVSNGEADRRSPLRANSGMPLKGPYPGCCTYTVSLSTRLLRQPLRQSFACIIFPVIFAFC
ncbi:hypothetical protein EYF80_000155 [Liparis tanakae]|uniref:Uncharacterized protein n=1 Tax=Liparis tanakae TaxID=230148 RepID=A0A4Z2JJX8_9TELE|nr:hypothetical protein EYF80_000155 [Liparis tanakae]